MSDWLDAPRGDYARLSVPAIWVALALSALVHFALLWVWLPQLHLLSLENAEHGNASGPLVVELAREPSQATVTPPAAPSAPPPQPRASRIHRARPLEAAPHPPSTPPVIALDPAPAAPASPAPMIEPTPTVPSPPPVQPVAAPAVAPSPPPAAVASPTPAPVEGDLSSYIEARRRARGQVAPDGMRDAAPRDVAPRAPSLEDEAERRNRIIAANLGLQRTPTVGYDPKGGGGIFEIQRMSYDAAEFIFYGWNKDIRRNSKQLIEVARGDNSDIRVAVVRRMIAIIREAESGDFVWVSQRLGRNVMLSARPRDDVELEAFMMQEFFADPRRPR